MGIYVWTLRTHLRPFTLDDLERPNHEILCMVDIRYNVIYMTNKKDDLEMSN